MTRRMSPLELPSEFRREAAPLGSLGPLLWLTLGGQEFVLELRQIERIVPMLAWTPVRSNRHGVVGLIRVQGQPIPVVDARPRLGLHQGVPTLEQPLLLLAAPLSYALWVDRVLGLLDPPTIYHSLELPPESPFCSLIPHGQHTLPLLDAEVLAPHGFLRLESPDTP